MFYETYCEIDVQVFDMRSRKEVGEIKAHVDYITDLVYIGETHQLIASSGDTSITVNDMRTFKTTLQSHDGKKINSCIRLQKRTS